MRLGLLSLGHWKACGGDGCFQVIMGFSERDPFSKTLRNLLFFTPTLPLPWRSFEKWEYCTWSRGKNLNYMLLWMHILFPSSLETSNATQLPLIWAAQNWDLSFILKQITKEVKKAIPLWRSFRTKVFETNAYIIFASNVSIGKFWLNPWKMDKNWWAVLHVVFG